MVHYQTFHLEMMMLKWFLFFVAIVHAANTKPSKSSKMTEASMKPPTGSNPLKKYRPVSKEEDPFKTIRFKNEGRLYAHRETLRSTKYYSRSIVYSGGKHSLENQSPFDWNGFQDAITHELRIPLSSGQLLKPCQIPSGTYHMLISENQYFSVRSGPAIAGDWFRDIIPQKRKKDTWRVYSIPTRRGRLHPIVIQNTYDGKKSESYLKLLGAIKQKVIDPKYTRSWINYASTRWNRATAQALLPWCDNEKVYFQSYGSNFWLQSEKDKAGAFIFKETFSPQTSFLLDPIDLVLPIKATAPMEDQPLSRSMAKAVIH